MSLEEKRLAKRDGNRISYERRKAQLGNIVMVSANGQCLSGAFLLDPIPHGVMIQMLIHIASAMNSTGSIVQVKYQLTYRETSTKVTSILRARRYHQPVERIFICSIG